MRRSLICVLSLAGLYFAGGAIAQTPYLLAASYGGSQVKRFNAQTGALVDTLVPPGNGLNGTRGLRIGPDGKLYVASGNSNEVWDHIRTASKPPSIGPAPLTVYVVVGSEVED